MRSGNGPVPPELLDRPSEVLLDREIGWVREDIAALTNPQVYGVIVQRLDTQAIQQYLGRRNIQHTMRYTELVSDRFKDFWQD